MRYLTTALVILASLALVGGCKKSPKTGKPLPPPKIVKEIPAEANPLRKTYEAEELGKDLSKGEVTADPAASNQMALYVKPGAIAAGGYVAWGPYEEIAPGKYIARWRIKAAKLPNNGKPILSLDVSGYPKDDRANYKMLVSKNVMAADLPEPNKYYTFDLTFEVTAPFSFELRTQYLQNCDLWLDWASLELAK